MSRVTVYSTANCQICIKAKAMLGKWNIDYNEVRIDENEATMNEFRRITGNARTVPQIVIDDTLIGGFSELTELHMDGDLDELMVD